MQGWQWGSCSDDVKYGVHFAQNFIDARELDLDHSDDEETRKTLIHLHNNAAGRRVSQEAWYLMLVTYNCSTDPMAVHVMI